jgi:hypothetical protein
MRKIKCMYSKEILSPQNLSKMSLTPTRLFPAKQAQICEYFSHSKNG